MNSFLFCLIRASLSLEQSDAASVIGMADGSANTRQVDPRVELQAVTGKNTQEAREEREEPER